ncbi:MAG TPA: DUF6058 family natural product biosynthesis protein [Lysobacter sp.]|nr:DUF6058 family natural product biosynthesis protein [Lysobacter sp.]
MSELDRYLRDHYLDGARFAAACGIPVETLQQLVDARLVPAPSYVVEDGILHSVVFGPFAAVDVTGGRYFHPGNAAWVALALRARDEHGEQAGAWLEARFRRRFADALAECDRAIGRLPDAFTDAGAPIADGLRARTDAAWTHFRQGVFGLCVADPSTERSIARKEVLQEVLARLSDNGIRREFDDDVRERLPALIDDYARAAMPFAPVEYSRSSRKRLVEDLRAALAVAA